MKRIDIGETVQIVSSLAIVLTLILLTVEIRSNTAAVQAASLQALGARSQDLQLSVALDPELAAIQASYLNSSVENQRSGSYLIAVLKIAEESYLQYQAGLLDEDYWQTRASFAVNHFQSSEVRERLPNFTNVLIPEFYEWLEQAVNARFGEKDSE